MKFDIVGVGNALVDETFYVDKQFVDFEIVHFALDYLWYFCR